MKCPDCETENPDTRKFCRKCGGKLLIICSQCDSENLPGDIFCGECGQKLSIPPEPFQKDLSFDEKLDKIQRYLPKGLTEKILSQRDRIEGERKQVTVMFCDMEGFTSFSERIGPEEAYLVMDQVYEILIHKVHDFEGTVNEMTGDGIVALFGAPIALEDTPQRAIRAALAIHKEMAKFSKKVGQKSRTLPIRMRVGIHTGPVVVGALGNDLRVEFKAVGDTVNLASRMEEIAEPGTTYVTEDTFTITEGLFRFEGLGDRKIKGKEKPIKIYRVLAPSTSRTRFDVSSERGLTPFIGRERELELLLDGFERAKAGRGQAFSIVAEAGLGKSRLLYEFRKAIANENQTFLEGKCISYSRNVAYHPIIDFLKSNFRILESDGDSEIKEKVKLGIKTLDVDEATTLPYFLELLSVKDSGFDSIAISSEAKKDRTIDALKQIVLKGSELRPLIMTFEDLHWMDKNSEEAVKYLLEGIAGAKVLLIFTYRPEFMHTWGGRSYHSQLNLIRLSNRESLTMVTYLLNTEDIHEDLEALILEKTEGVPFFIEEFIRSLIDLKAIEIKDDMLCLTQDLQVITIPSHIQDVIMARVDSLPEGVKNVLQIGSVIGREFNHELINEVSGLHEQELLSYLSVLKDSELLYERGIYPKSTYVFKHALIQESVYQSLLKSTRQKYHNIIAKILEKRFPAVAETQPEILGYHFSEAGSAESAITYWQKAGEIAIRRSANIEAVDHITRGLELLKLLPATKERMRLELDLQITLGPALIAIKGFPPDSEDLYLRVKDLCEKVGTKSKLFIALWVLWWKYNRFGQYHLSLKLAEQLLDLAQDLHESDSLIGAHRALGSDFFWMGEFTKSRHHQERVISLYEPQQHYHLAYIHGLDPRCLASSFLYIILWFLGYPDQAMKKEKETLSFAYELSHSHSVAIALFFSAWLNILLQKIDEVYERAERLIKLSTEQKMSTYISIGAMFRSWALAIQGKEEIPSVQMRQAIGNVHETGTHHATTILYILMAEVCKSVGQLDGGLQALKEAQDMVNKTGGCYLETELHRLKGEILLSLSVGDQSEVESCFQEALNVSRRQKEKSLELRAAMSLSRLWQNQGKKEEARRLLSDIYSWFTEGLDTADLKEAKALLEELS